MGPELERALTTIELGESWLVEPRQVADDVWAPGVRVGVRPGSWFATTECFGPVLGVVRVGNLDEAIAVQNATPYGLTAGLHALDPGEIDHWCDLVEAGNLYVNRQTTGAVVQRQPFGGWKRSSVGATAKAGGPHYVAALRRWPAPDTLDPVATIEAFRRWADGPGQTEADPTGLRAERNVQRYRALGGAVVLRLGAGASAVAEPIARAAAAALSVRLVVSSAPDESDEALASRLPEIGAERLRISGDVSDALRSAAHDANLVVDDRPLSANPAVELPRWLREQAISRTLHRYGRLAPMHVEPDDRPSRD
jgi:RHH-type proline utilization regulon transcriptional repressor/proline dehydrogenase/delta 1-pyrroline-5-carboxylate dehydrogenase